MDYVLNKIEYKEILEVMILKLRDFAVDYKYLEEFINDAKLWDRKVHGLNYILTQCVEQLNKKNLNLNGLIDEVYNLPSELYFLIQEGDIRFIEKLFDENHSFESELESDLISVQNRINYGQ